MTTTEESRPDQAVSRAVRAEQLLADELLIEAFEVLEDSYTTTWRFTTIEDVFAREKLFPAINVVGKVLECASESGDHGTEDAARPGAARGQEDRANLRWRL